MIRVVDRLKSQHCRESTRKTYHNIWRTFSNFYLKLDKKPKDWDDRIVLFMVYLIQHGGLKSSTIRSYVSAIKGMLAEINIKINDDCFEVKALTCACHLKNDKIIMRLPIYKELLERLLLEVQCLFSDNGQYYLMKLYMALMSSAYFGLLRKGEVSKGPHVLLARNIHVATNKNKMLFILMSSKTHTPGGNPQMVKISNIPLKGNGTPNKPRKHKNPLCPFYLLKEYIGVHPKIVLDEEQFFVFADHTLVKPMNCHNTLRT